MPDRIKESDWKLLNKNLPGWQEAHMEKLLKGYKELLCMDEGAAERFWELDDRMKRNKRSAGVIVRGLSRSNALANIISLLGDEVIAVEDLYGFSGEVLEAAEPYIERQDS
ncbi:multidrug transporter [Curtanaerobium respiraculi]|uniref:multidrug transporter n=1 Tax=Curtanaerobium respiraculi TaxID=2949669 RepID=UPI0024B37C7E|nr:multidrug transporter [Curtanaerobium respiraculi]